MREESHLDDMRTAIRGDFERLAERRGGQELMRSSEDATEGLQEPEAEPEPGPEDVVDDEVSEPTLEVDLEAVASVETQGGGQTPGHVPEGHVPASDHGTAEPTEEPPAEEELPRRSFWDRLLGR